MLSVSLGPLALPTGPIILLLAIWIAVYSGRHFAVAETKASAERVIWQAVTLALVAARIGHLGLNWLAYYENPWSIIDIRDGGWSWFAGLAAGLVWLGWQSRRRPGACRATLYGALSGIGFWVLAHGALWWSANASDERQVPEIAVVNLESGKSQPLNEVIRSKPAIVNLWATWCGPCRVEMPVLAAAQKRYPDITLVFLNQGETPAQISEFLSDEGLRLEHVWIDTQSQFGPAVGSQGLPTTIFYDKRGHRVDAHFGILSAAALRIQAERLISSLTE